MLKKYLDDLKDSTGQEKFIVLMEIITDDIKFNRLGFGKKTKSTDIIDIIKNSMPLLKVI